MIRNVRLDGVDNYLLDTSSNTIVNRYDSENKNLSLVITLDDKSVLEVDNFMIKNSYGGQVFVQQGEDRYIIDDGYQNNLIKTGYIVYKNYDTEMIYDNNTGISLRENFIQRVREAMESIKDTYSGTITAYGNGTDLELIHNGYSYIINVTTVNHIVNKNQRRKENSLPYYPFRKDMDKFGTMYLCVFAQRIDNYIGTETASEKYELPDSIIIELIKKLGADYHYASMPIRGKVLYFPGL